MNDTNYNHLKMTKGGNFHSGNGENKNNNSMEIQIDTQYSKKNIKSMGKKVKIFISMMITFKIFNNSIQFTVNI